MDDDQLLRYSRQIMLPQVDVRGQEALLASRVLVIGLGGLGCPVAIYLAASGVGHLVLADHDAVDLSNLQRQIAHLTGGIGRPKVESAADMLRQLNPGVAVDTVNARLEGDNLDAAVADSDVVVDCTDNFTARYAINAAAVKHRVPLVSGAAIRMEGQLSVFDARDADSPCYQCLYEQGSDAQLNCAENGVMAPLVGIIGSLQALEAIKLITGVGRPLVGRLLLFDASGLQFHELQLVKNPTCPVCG